MHVHGNAAPARFSLLGLKDVGAYLQYKKNQSTFIWRLGKEGCVVGNISACACACVCRCVGVCVRVWTVRRSADSARLLQTSATEGGGADDDDVRMKMRRREGVE